MHQWRRETHLVRRTETLLRFDSPYQARDYDSRPPCCETVRRIARLLLALVAVRVSYVQFVVLYLRSFSATVLRTFVAAVALSFTRRGDCRFWWAWAIGRMKTPVRLAIALPYNIAFFKRLFARIAYTRSEKTHLSFFSAWRTRFADCRWNRRSAREPIHVRFERFDSFL